MVAASCRTSVLHSRTARPAVQGPKLGSAGRPFRILSALSAAELNWPPTRCRWSGCAGGSGVVLELLQLALATRPTASMMSTPTRNLQVCRHPCTRALTRMLACHMRLCLGRLFYTLKGYGVEFIHPEACLVVLVAGQRSQASLAIG